MTEFFNTPQPLTKPVVASAEEELVMLDGLGGVAIIMTPDTVQRTGTSLISAAEPV
ncbi:hypothetical protein [Sphingobium phenoxybenzoativorans]|uniref:hypothetical protein n=1 Tax=Sphingobium phenoxybenzoativorans TaxID=1592790 RepID=UPI001495D1BA|nr:hypothetical protein [Sphingobium phenoxybenzoativorans]